MREGVEARAGEGSGEWGESVALACHALLRILCTVLLAHPHDIEFTGRSVPLRPRTSHHPGVRRRSCLASDRGLSLPSWPFRELLRRDMLADRARASAPKANGRPPNRRAHCPWTSASASGDAAYPNACAPRRGGDTASMPLSVARARCRCVSVLHWRRGCYISADFRRGGGRAGTRNGFCLARRGARREVRQERRSRA